MPTIKPSPFFHIWSGPIKGNEFAVCIHETGFIHPGFVPPVTGYRYRGTVMERPTLDEITKGVNAYECRLRGVFRGDLIGVN